MISYAAAAAQAEGGGQERRLVSTQGFLKDVGRLGGIQSKVGQSFEDVPMPVV